MRHPRLIAALLLAVAAGTVGAHEVPVDPNTCTFDPVGISTTAGTAAVVAPADADALRIVYTVDTAEAQFQAAKVPPRAFTFAGTDGLIAFPAVFAGVLTSHGDLTLPGVALTITVGGVATTVPVDLGTGLVMAGDELLEGTPIGSSGVLGLVGIVPAGVLPPPLADQVTLSLRCPLLPLVPDLDQFAASPAVQGPTGTLAATKGRLRAVLTAAADLSARLTAGPVVARVTVGGGEVALVALPPLQPQGRLLVATSADGTRLSVKTTRKRTKTIHRLTLDLPAAATASLPTGRTEIRLTLAAGQVMARGNHVARVKKGKVHAS